MSNAYLLLFRSSSAFPSCWRGRCSLLQKENTKVEETHPTMDHLPVKTNKQNNPAEVQGAVPESVCRWQQRDFNETDRWGHRVHWPLSGRPTRTTHRGTPVRWPPGLRLRDSWWDREETNRPRPGLPRSLLHLCTNPPADPVQSGRGRAHGGAARLGWGKKKKNQLLLWKRQPEKN